MTPSKVGATQIKDDEAAQRRDAIVRIMAKTSPQPRPAQRRVRPRRKEALAASDQCVSVPDATS